MSAIFFFVFMLAETDQYYSQMVEVRRHLHQNPELSNREFKTHDYLKDRLLSAGFKDVKTIAKTGLRVVYDTGRPGRTLAFRADIDALPVTEQTGLPYASKNAGAMHACGHDLHTGILFGTALAIKNSPNLVGAYVFLFQPAEEGPPAGEEGGASLMIRDGALENPKPDVIFGLHNMGSYPVGTIGYRTKGILARADRFRLMIMGTQTHGSMPHLGIDPIVVASEVVNALQTVVSRKIDTRDPVVLSVGTLQAGQRFNIIPQEAHLTGTIRSFNPETGDRIPELMDQVIEGITKAHGASYIFENETMCPSTQNHSEWTIRVVESIKQAGFDTTEVLPSMAAEDFAYYAEQIPGVYFFLGACDAQDCANIHSPRYAPSEESLKTGAAYFYHLAQSFGPRPEAL